MSENVERRAGAGTVRVWTSTPAGSEPSAALRTKVGGAYVQNTVDEKSIADVLAHGRRCVGAQCRQGQIADVFRLQIDLDRRARKGSGGKDPRELQRELDSRTKPGAGTLSRTEIEALSGNDYLNLLAVCYHESAHAVAGVLAGNNPHEVGLRCEKQDGVLVRVVGHCTMRSGAMTPLQWMAGQAGEEIHGFPPHILGKGSDEDRSRAAEMEERGVETGLLDAKALLRKHWKSVKWLAIELQHEHVVSGAEATRVIMSAPDWDTRFRLQAAARAA